MRLSLFLLLLPLLTFRPAWAQQPEPLRQVQLEKTFHTSTGQRLELDLATAATVTLSGWDKEEVAVEVDAEGKYLEVTCRQEEGVVYLKSRFTQVTDEAFARGTIRIRLPYQLSVRGRITSGDVTLRELRGETQLQTGPGFLTGYDLQGQLLLDADNGQVELFGGSIQGTLSAPQGSVKVTGLQGQFSMQAPAGQFAVNSFEQPVTGQVGTERMTLSVSEGDVTASATGSTMEVIWQGDPQQAQRSLSLTGTDSRITLYVPEALGMDAELDQISTQKPTGSTATTAAPAVASSLESDFDLGVLPAARTFTHQGKAHKLVQVRKKINKGGNRLQVRTADCQVKIKKLKKAVQ
jgi:hypothetical protein